MPEPPPYGVSAGYAGPPAYGARPGSAYSGGLVGLRLGGRARHRLPGRTQGGVLGGPNLRGARLGRRRQTAALRGSDPRLWLRHGPRLQ